MNISNSIIICTRNRPADIIQVLNSIETQTEKPNEIIIVDSSDNQLLNLPDFVNNFSAIKFPQTNLIYKHTEPGLTYQRNIGVKAATCDIIHFFDDDVVLENNYLQEMNKIFIEHPQYAGGMGTIENIPANKKSFNLFLRKIFMLQRIYASGKFTLSGMPQHPYGTDKFKSVKVLAGGLTAYRSFIFKKHLFDENLKRYCYMEDCDFSARVSFEYPLFYNPKAKLKHFHSELARDRVEESRAMYIKNYSYLFFKNFYPRNKFKIFAYIWTITGLFAEGLIYRNMPYLRGYFKGLKSFYFNK